MEILYYPHLYVESEDLLKQLLLCWGKVSTIVPPSEKELIEEILSGKKAIEMLHPLQHYREIYDVFGSAVVDFTVIDEEIRHKASYKMLDLILNWNQDTHFYDDLKIKDAADWDQMFGKWYWVKNDKLDHELVEVLLEEKLVLNWKPGELVGFQEVGKSYMSLMADELKNARGARLITDDAFFIAAKSGSLVDKNIDEERYEVVSLAIPQVFIDKRYLSKLSWQDVNSIRNDLLPYSSGYYTELERYQAEINSFSSAGNGDAAFELFCEFCERIAASFSPFAKEKRKLRKYLGDADTVGVLNGLLLPSIKLQFPDPLVTQVCDYASIAATAGSYSVPKGRKVHGFEYLENLNRRLSTERFKQMVSCLIPRSISERR